LTTIRKGQRIIEYIGERIGPALETKRYNEETMARHHTFLFSIDDYTTIDAAVGGNDARFINHSCDPNCEALDDGGRIFIFAQRTIYPGEELTYDYRFKAPGRITRELREFYVCLCGTARCRGTILDIKPSQNGSRSRHQHPGRHADHARGKRA
jgi:SET domain-containing protein